MYNFSFISVLVLMLVVFGAQGAEARLKCKMKAEPQVTVTPVQSNIIYDFSKSKADLNRVDVDTISPYGPHHKTDVSGLMSGSIQLQSNVGFMHETYKHFGRGCVYLKGVDVTIHLKPTIYIANDFKKGGCMYNAILAHEFKHVREDQLIINKYTNLIGKELERVVDRQGKKFGPVRLSYMPEIQLQVKNAIERVVVKINDKMNIERRKRQQAIDNIEEYDSVGRRCKDRS